MKALRRYFRTAKAGKGATPRHDPVVSIFPFEYATRGIGRRRECLSGGGDGSQHRGLQAFGYLAGDRQPGVGLERPDRSPGPGAEDAVSRPWVVPQPAQCELQIGDSGAGVVRIARSSFRGGGGRPRRTLFLCRRFPGPPFPGQALRLGEFGRGQPHPDPITVPYLFLAKLLFRR